MEVLLNWIKELAGTSVSLPKSVGYGLGYSKTNKQTNKKWPLDFFTIILGYTVIHKVHSQNIRYSEREVFSGEGFRQGKKDKKEDNSEGVRVEGVSRELTQINQRQYSTIH